MDRRDFLKKSVAVSLGTSAAVSVEEQILLAHAEQPLVVTNFDRT